MENLWINLVVDYKEKKIGLFSFKLSMRPFSSYNKNSSSVRGLKYVITLLHYN